MKGRTPCRALLAALALAAGQQASGLRVTPVQKALEMLQGLITKAGDAKHQEEVQYAGFKQFCDMVTVEKQNAIEKADGEIETLQADILNYDSEVERLNGEITGHKGDIVGWSGDSDAASKVRATEESDYLEKHKDLTESVHAIAEAIRVLKAQEFDRKGESAALLQKAAVVVATMDPKCSKAITAFLEQDPDLKFEAPEVPTTAYEFQSGGIIDMLEKLQVKFRDELTQLEKDEVDRAHAHTTLLQDLKSQTDAAKDNIDSKTAALNKNQEMSNEANGDLKMTQDTRKADAAYLADLSSGCERKATDFAARQKLRTEEIEALEKAVEILSSKEVQGNAEKHLPKAASLLKKAKSSFAQLRSSYTASSRSPLQQEAFAFLREAAERLGSHTLSTLAVKARDDPFAKVKTLIEELLERLVSEATAEASHKGWCDEALATNEHTRTTQSEKVEMLTGETEKLNADIAVLKKEITETNAQLAQLEGDVANATDLRNTEKADNEATVQDAKDGQAAMAEVIKVLQDFYGEAAKATALLQRKKKIPEDAPEIFGDEAYTGMQAESGGILGMMEVINSDFVRLESDTQAAEQAAAAAYDKFMEESSISKAQFDKDVEFKSGEQKNKEIIVMEKQEALETAQKSLENANKEYESLKPPCINTGMSYEERKARREDEVAALKEALRILSGDDAVIGERY
eukprot:TRINITY_DN38_c3_g1_i1.p2 TRINITY_DN38_c3_g1~~TRINITY_DN38_c3_g1_i1.p2  ORF type:complete len:691 (+),score=321.67 TRINITY_DN38_c3_g1_i1:110-2182(+)